ncbi:RidA family protein [Halovivax gelatinilyticus]|uniref:RidA family protein n=1 Tax=Halovivax gelatinilyticus TaxID=2961597 RepID=UPI0020CA69E9|nr:RidA family protein [Halovivax gelatinilyticus]
MKKTVIGADVGSDLSVFDSVDGVSGLPHSEAVVVDHGTHKQLYVSGTGPLDSNGDVVAPDDVAKQLQYVLDTIEELLALAGGDLRDVVRLELVTEALDDDEYIETCRVRESVLPDDHLPASTMITSPSVGLDGMRIEADAEAVIPADEWELEHVSR